MPLFLLVISILLSACSPISTHTAVDNTSRFNTLITELKQVISVQKITEARAIYSTTLTAQTGNSEASLTLKIDDAIKQARWQECLSLVDKLLNANYLSIKAHYSAMVCHYETHSPSVSAYHERMVNALLAAIWETGDGVSYETAFLALNDQDIASFIEFHGLELQTERHKRIDSQSYIITELSDPKTQKYFQWFFLLAAD